MDAVWLRGLFRPHKLEIPEILEILEILEIPRTKVIRMRMSTPSKPITLRFPSVRPELCKNPTTVACICGRLVATVCHAPDITGQQVTFGAWRNGVCYASPEGFSGVEKSYVGMKVSSWLIWVSVWSFFSLFSFFDSIHFLSPRTDNGGIRENRAAECEQVGTTYKNYVNNIILLLRI